MVVRRWAVRSGKSGGKERNGDGDVVVLSGGGGKWERESTVEVIPETRRTTSFLMLSAGTGT